MAVNPGPIDPSVLSKQADHRSENIWNPIVLDTLKENLVVRRWDSKYWDYYASSPTRVKEYIDMLGFGGVSRVGHHNVDWSLITSLVERWRSETHTFHLPCGETTITLQDIALLWGLPIDGEALIADTSAHCKEYWQQECLRLLGMQVPFEELDHNRLNKRILMNHLLVELPENPTNGVCLWRARSMILFLIGGLLFCDGSGSKVHLKYLQFLEDFKRPIPISWGSAVLAYLYRSLCSASCGSAFVFI